MKENFKGVGSRLRQKIIALGITQSTLCKQTNLSKNAMSNYINGNRIPDTTAIYKLSKALSVSVEWLLTGKETVQAEPPCNCDSEKSFADEEIALISAFRELPERLKGRVEGIIDNYLPEKRPVLEEPVQMVDKDCNIKEEKQAYLPLLGEAAAGQPIWIEELLEDYIPVPAKHARGKAFIVRAKGDSMIGAGIKSSDLVVIRSQSTVAPKEPALVRLNDEATIKYVEQKNGQITLQPANPAYQPIPVTKEDRCKIIGKVVHIIPRDANFL